MNNSVLLNQDVIEPCSACSTGVIPPLSLYAEVCSRATLVRAARAVFASVLRSPEDAGTGVHIEERLASFFDDLQAELVERRYAPGMVLRGWQNREGRRCRMRILSLKDRVVHTALFIVLEKALTVSRHDLDSRACPKERLLAAIRETVCSGSSEYDTFAVEAGGLSCGDLHLDLMRMIVGAVRDDDLMQLMKLFLRAPVIAALSDRHPRSE